jgi:hypothetical protein
VDRHVGVDPNWTGDVGERVVLSLVFVVDERLLDERGGTATQAAADRRL